MENPFKQFSKIDPQVEDGHRRIVTSVYRALLLARVSSSELKVCFAIIDLTWGYQKTEDSVAISQLSGLTGFSHRTIQRAINSLKSKRVIYYERSTPKVSSNSTEYYCHPSHFLFNKYFDTWTCLTPDDLVILGDKTCKKGVTEVSYSKERRSKEKEGDIVGKKETIPKPPWKDHVSF